MADGRAAAKRLRVVREPLREVGGEQLLIGLRSSLAWLQANQDVVNDLNVFPVPDGDTGSNMYLTLRSAVEEAQRARDPKSAGSVLRAVAHGSLMGARGNSGVILSQIFRGFAQGVGDLVILDAAAVARGLKEAANVAYKAVMKPTEGTILTVTREAGDAALAAADETNDIRVVLERAVREAHAAVERTTDQLAVLAEAGVVDAGGFGFAVVLEGFARALSDSSEGETPLPAPRRRSGEPRVHLPGANGDNAAPAGDRRGAAAVGAPEHGWGYCTEFLVNGPGVDFHSLRNELSGLGESALIVGDEDLVRVHIHTDDPAALIAVASQRGRLSKLKVEDMTAQHHHVLEQADAADAAAARAVAPPKPLGVVAVAPGDGFRDIFGSLGVDAVVEGGQTMNPSIEDLLTAVEAANADEVILLPNNGNVILTAQQVDALAEGTTVQVIPTRNLPQGIAAILALDTTTDASANRGRMEDAIKLVSAVEITRAVRDTRVGGLSIKSGNVIALVDDKITAAGPDEATVIETVLRDFGTTPEIITFYRGAGVDEDAAQSLVDGLRKTFSKIEFELHEGGQEHYPYILSVE